MFILKLNLLKLLISTLLLLYNTSIWTLTEIVNFFIHILHLITTPSIYVYIRKVFVQK